MEAAALDDEQLGEFSTQKRPTSKPILNNGDCRCSTVFKTAFPKRAPNKRKLTPNASGPWKRRFNRKDKALAETAALLVLKKKVQEIWGDEDDPTAGSNGK